MRRHTRMASHWTAPRRSPPQPTGTPARASAHAPLGVAVPAVLLLRGHAWGVTVDINLCACYLQHFGKVGPLTLAGSRSSMPS